MKTTNYRYYIYPCVGSAVYQSFYRADVMEAFTDTDLETFAKNYCNKHAGMLGQYFLNTLPASTSTNYVYFMFNVKDNLTSEILHFCVKTSVTFTTGTNQVTISSIIL